MDEAGGGTGSFSWLSLRVHSQPAAARVLLVLIKALTCSAAPPCKHSMQEYACSSRHRPPSSLLFMRSQQQ
jgi:hypothetical protein